MTVELPPAHAGLTTAAAAERLQRDGPNRLPSQRGTPWPVALAGQLVHFFALMLWAASGLAWLAGLPSLSVAIAGVVVLNALFAFVQEHRADRAAERLRLLIPTEVRVRRDGIVAAIDASEVVEGDLLVLEAGDRVPADGIAQTTRGLLVDTSLLTGESGSVPVAEREPLYAGTFVVEGDGDVLVTATGARTRLAHIAALTSATSKPDTPLTTELRRVVRTIARIAVGVGVGFWLLTVLLGRPVDESLVFAIGVTVALVPEALLPTVTLSLAWGAEQMAHRNVLVRHLDAVETLGSATFVCTDKTGTLTRNEMSVVEAWTTRGAATISGAGYSPHGLVSPSDGPATSALQRLAVAGVLSSTGFARPGEDPETWIAHGEPMDAALDVFARRLGVDSDAIRAGGIVNRFAFDARLRRVTVVTGDRVVVKGAPELVLPLCPDATDEAREWCESRSSLGLRLLAVAGRPWSGPPPADRAQAETSLELYGLVALEDPPREGVAEAIAACRRSGIAVAMLTGDHPATAGAIAERIGLLGPDRLIVTGDELPAEEGMLGALLDRDGVVVARVAPEDKLRIARALRARGHVVAMTGDGVNDAPALREADIGVAMGRSGTDVAREAADLVLLDDHFASIVAGIEQGRATYVNIRRFLAYHLTDNVAELTPFAVWALSGGSFPLALGVLQILALDLGTDTLSAVALGAEPPAADTLDGPPVSGRLLDRTVARRAFGVLGPVVAVLTMSAFLVSLAASGWRPGDEFPTGADLLAASGAAFMTVVLGQTANAFACRSWTQTPRRLGWTSNRLLVPAATIELGFSLLVVLTPVFARELEHAAPSVAGWAVALAAAPVVLVVDLVDKRVARGRRA